MYSGADVIFGFEMYKEQKDPIYFSSVEIWRQKAASEQNPIVEIH